jgi:ketosteroid isomerase-like protein
MRKKFVLAALIAAAHILPVPVFGQVSDRPSNDTLSAEKDVRGLAGQLANAIVERDIPTLERLLTDDFVDINPDGAVSPRAQFIDEYKNPPATANKFESAEFGAGDSQIRFYGDVAILTGPSIWRGRTAEGHSFTGTLVTSMVAVRTDGRWKIATTHSSSVP